MKIIGKSKKGHRILMVTKYEWNIIQEALFEWQYLQEQYDEYEDCLGNTRKDQSTYLTDIKRINNRLIKAVEKFESQVVFKEKKEIE